MMKHFPLRFGIVILLISVLCGCELKPGKNNSDTNKQQEGNHVTIPDDNKIPDNHKTPESGKAEAEESELAVLQQQIAENGYGAGVSFLGYVDSELHMTELSNYLEAGLFMEKYPFLMDADCFMTEGQELYAIVPPNKKGQIMVYASEITEEGVYADDKSKSLFTGKPGEVLILKCNFSEIYSNVLVTVTDGGGAIEFRPSISLRDGHLAELEDVYDFTVYEDFPDGQSIEIALEMLYEIDEVRQALENGMSLMYIGNTDEIDGGSCMLFELGTDGEYQFVREQLYGVCDNRIYAYDVIGDAWTIIY